IGLFSGTNLGYDGAVLQMVAHGLMSATLFLIAGAVERRTTTDEFALLGGMAKGRPALATLLMTVGVISLAVPGSAAFAGEFLILAGAFQRDWWWALIGATGIVLAPARRTFATAVSALGFVGGLVTSVWLYVNSADGHRVISDAFYRDRWTALSQVILCGIGLATSLVAWEHVARPRDNHIAE